MTYDSMFVPFHIFVAQKASRFFKFEFAVSSDEVTDKHCEAG